jgi:hypothetical protein
MNRNLTCTVITIALILFCSLQLRAQDVQFAPNNPDDPYIILQAVKNPHATSETVVRFDDRVSLVYNPAKDKMFKPGYGKVSLAAVSGNDKDLSVFTVPFPNAQSEQIKLNVNATNNGAYNLSFKNAASIPDLYNVWLKDACKKDSINIKIKDSYSFNIDNTDTTTFGTGRFTLVISQKKELAYQLIDFSAEKNANLAEAKLIWKTLNEHGYTNFAAERSNDAGKTFNEIGGMQSNGSGAYCLFDKNPVSGVNYYRLKQVDFNNHVTYSEVIPVQVNGINLNLPVQAITIKTAM